MSERISVAQYSITLAYVTSLRSEDPFRKVGAVALDHNNRIIGAAYNGLLEGFNPPADFWQSRNQRRKFMLHAEVNLCSLFKRNQAAIVAVTTMPCSSCMQTLCAHGIKTVYYCEDYPDSEAPAIAKMYQIELTKVTPVFIPHAI